MRMSWMRMAVNARTSARPRMPLAFQVFVEQLEHELVRLPDTRSHAHITSAEHQCE